MQTVGHLTLSLTETSSWRTAVLMVEQTSIIDWFGEYMPDPTLGEGVYSVIYNGRLPMAYRDISVTEDYIYALYSDRSFKEYGMKQLECLYYVYNWSGKQIALYEFDLPLRCLYVDESARRIYGVADNPDPELVYYDY